MELCGLYKFLNSFGIFPNAIFSIFGFRGFPEHHFFSFWLSGFFPNAIFSVFGFRDFPEHQIFKSQPSGFFPNAIFSVFGFLTLRKCPVIFSASIRFLL